MSDSIASQDLFGLELDLIKVLSRLESVVEEETSLLTSNETSQLEVFCERKSRMLLEINRSMRLLQNANRSSAVVDKLKTLRNSIKKNQIALKKQLAAVGELASFLEVEARRDQVDGTYSRSIGRSGI